MRVQRVPDCASLHPGYAPAIIQAMARKRMDVFKEYKPVRNRIASLARDDALAVIWAYCQYLQIDDFKFLKEIEVAKKYLELDIPQAWIAWLGFFLTRPAINFSFKSDIKRLPAEKFEKFFAFTGKPILELKSILKTEQQYDARFAYAYNSLRAYPLVRMSYQGNDSIVCPLPTLLFWRFTGGLYYELIGDPRFANEFGDGFQAYAGEVIERACPKCQRIAEHEYVVGKSRKRTVDWIVANENSALFLECKSKRLSWGAKVSLTDLAPLESDIDNMAAAVVQVYKTLADYDNNLYPEFPAKEGREIYPAVVVLENWRMFGPVMVKKLDDAVAAKLAEVGIELAVVQQRPYSIWSIEELEGGLQIINSVGIADFLDGKLKDTEMRQWDWHGYMTNQHKKHFPLKKLFDKEYDEMSAELYAAQKTENLKA